MTTTAHGDRVLCTWAINGDASVIRFCGLQQTPWLVLLATAIKSRMRMLPMTTSATSGPKRRPGRPPKPQADSSSALGQLGKLIRELRADRGLTLMALGGLTGYSWQHIGAVERGQVAPSEELVVACERALAAGGRLVASFPAVVREQASLRHEREAARRDNIVRTDGEIDWCQIAAAAQRPSAVSASIVEQLEQITDRQRVLHHELSSAEMLISVEAHLSLLISLMHGSQKAPLRHRIASAAVEAAGFAGWLWFDLGDQFKMRKLYELTGSLLGESGNPALSSYITGYQALTADGSGMRREAIDHAEAARSRAPASLSRLTLSWIAAIGASAVALQGDQRAALELAGQARSYFDTANGKEEWMYDFDHSSLAVYLGQCHLRLGQPREAVAAYSAGLAELPHGCDRRAAFLAIGLAEACLLGRELDAAVHHANRALDVFAHRASAAGLMRVQSFRDQLAAAGHQDYANELDERVRHHLATQT